MMDITLDILGYIINFIETNKDKCYFLMTCKGISNTNFKFNEMINLKNIYGKTRWFDNFINVMMDEETKLKKYIFPFHVTHLTFGFWYDQPIDGIIPYGVTHLTFGCCFNQNIKDCLPDTVTHLTIGHAFSKPLINCIPLSITHLVVYKHGAKFLGWQNGFCLKQKNKDLKKFLSDNKINLEMRGCSSLCYML